MRSIVAVVVSSLLVLASHSPLRADDQAECRKVIDKAIKAMGGAAKLAKNQGLTWKEKGTYFGMGTAQPYTGSFAVQYPNHYRMEVEGVFTIVFAGDKGWIRSNNETKEMTKDQLEEQKETQHAGWVASLLPLKDKAFTLAPLGETQVDKMPALGIKVSSKGHRDVNLFFDKDSGLLVKSAHRAKAAEQEGKEVNQEAFYSNYKDVEGMKVFMKIVIRRDGELYVESENTELKLAEKLDDSVFAKP